MKSETLAQILQNRDRFRKYLSRRLDNEAAAEEILQHALLRALESEGHLQNRDRVIPWFYRVLRNALTDHYRREATQTQKYREFMNELEVGSAQKVASADELGSAICQCVNGLLPTLRPAYVELLRSIDLESQPPETVAKRLGISVNNLWVRLHRARAALRKSLVQTCGACSTHACLECNCKV